MFNAALDEENGDVVLRGALDPKCLHMLLRDEYQREILPLATIQSLVAAFETGSVPDIELGMRGEDFNERDGAVYLTSPVYIIDGLQRVSAALHKLNAGGKLPRLGATVHFNTTEEWERKRFQILNAERTKLSPNVLLRNMKHEYSAIGSLIDLTHDKTFILCDKVCWDQRMKRHDLISAVSFLKIIGVTHSHIGPGRSQKVDELARGVNTIADKIGKNVFRDNVKTFFDLVDQCWGIRRIAFKEGAVYMRSTFLITLAMVLSRHENFWRGNRLFIEAPLVRKIAQFPTADPQVQNLSSASGKAREILYMLLVSHINSGKRTKKLRLRKGLIPISEEIAEIEQEGDVQEAAG